MQVRIEEIGEQLPKQWKKYLINDQNKSDNVKFLLEDWSMTSNAHLFPPAYFISCASQILRLILRDGRIKCVSALICHQEEAGDLC